MLPQRTAGGHTDGVASDPYLPGKGSDVAYSTITSRTRGTDWRVSLYEASDGEESAVWLRQELHAGTGDYAGISMAFTREELAGLFAAVVEAQALFTAEETAAAPDGAATLSTAPSDGL